MGRYEFHSRLLGGPEGGWNRLRGPALAAVPVPLPYDYVVGIDTQRIDFEGRLRSYLRGEWRGHGWWYWYLYALAVKTPLGVLILGAGALVATAGRPTIDGLTIWLPALTLLALVSSQTGLTMNFRYLLPAVPFAVIGIARRRVVDAARLAALGGGGTVDLVVAECVARVSAHLGLFQRTRWRTGARLVAPDR